jgi:hypothetical protein
MFFIIPHRTFFPVKYLPADHAPKSNKSIIVAVLKVQKYRGQNN